MSDGFEYRYGFNPWDNGDADNDPDNDGNTNYEEYVAGTIPTNPASFFAITNIAKSGVPITTTITWKSVSGKNYSVYYSDEVMGGAMTWTLAEGNIAGSGTGENTWTDDGTHTTPAPGNCTRRQYKIGVQ
jgi:hypothetical protein